MDDKARLTRARESIEDLEADLLYYKDLYTAQINKVAQLEAENDGLRFALKQFLMAYEDNYWAPKVFSDAEHALGGKDG